MKKLLLLSLLLGSFTLWAQSENNFKIPSEDLVKIEKMIEVKTGYKDLKVHWSKAKCINEVEELSFLNVGVCMISFGKFQVSGSASVSYLISDPEFNSVDDIAEYQVNIIYSNVE